MAGGPAGSPSGERGASSGGAAGSATAGSGGASSGGAAGSANPSDAGPDGGCTALRCDAGCLPNDVHNCGACGHDCTMLSHVSGPVTCNSGQCSFPPSSCASPWSHCTSNPDDGCETDISKINSCGACGRSCLNASVRNPIRTTYARATGRLSTTKLLWRHVSIPPAAPLTAAGAASRARRTSRTRSLPA